MVWVDYPMSAALLPHPLKHLVLVCIKTGYWTDWTSGPIQYGKSYVIGLSDVLSFDLLPYGSCPASMLVEMLVQRLYHKELDSLRMDTKCAGLDHSVV